MSERDDYQREEADYYERKDAHEAASAGGAQETLRERIQQLEESLAIRSEQALNNSNRAWDVEQELAKWKDEAATLRAQIEALPRYTYLEVTRPSGDTADGIYERKDGNLIERHAVLALIPHTERR